MTTTAIHCPLRCGTTTQFEAEMDAHVIRCDGQASKATTSEIVAVAACTCPWANSKRIPDADCPVHSRPAAETISARNISCQGLALNVDPDVLTFHGTPVTGYADEVARRGEDHIYTCDLIGHIPDDFRITRVQLDAAIDALGLGDRKNDIAKIKLCPTEVWITEYVRNDSGDIIARPDGTPESRDTCVPLNMATPA